MERARASRQSCGEDVEHLRDTSLIPPAGWIGRRTEEPADAPVCAPWNWTRISLGLHRSLIAILIRALRGGSTRNCLTASSHARPRGVGSARVPVSCAARQARQAVLAAAAAAAVDHLYVRGHGLHPEHRL